MCTGRGVGGGTKRALRGVGTLCAGRRPSDRAVTDDVGLDVDKVAFAGGVEDSTRRLGAEIRREMVAAPLQGLGPMRMSFH